MKDIFKERVPALNINNSLPVARPGLRFIAVALSLWVICLAADWEAAAVFFFLAGCFVIWFFRDPERPAPPEGFGLAPADGRVIRIERVGDNPYTKAPALKVSIFMNVFNVHVNRAPTDGRILSQTYFPGAFVNASFDKASEQNERNAVLIETPKGPVATVQIAGLVARRIVSWVGDGDRLRRGQRFGMIRFGSRVDLYLPENSEIMVCVGQKVSAGWSPVWRDPQA